MTLRKDVCEGDKDKSLEEKLTKGSDVKKLKIPGFSLNLLPYAAAILTTCAGIYMEVNRVKLSVPSLSIGWGLIKDVTDMLIVLVFAWNGWIALPPLVMSLLLKWRRFQLSILLIFLSAVMGVSDTFISFDEPTILRCAKGTVFYLLVFAVVTGLCLTANWLITRIGKCQQ